MTHSYIALDLETTGLEAKTEKIIEIAALKVVERQIIDRFVTLVNPCRLLGERITELTGITDPMVENAPVIGDMIGQVVDFCGKLPLLGHNILFDYSFLKRAAVNEKLEFSCEGIDTLRLSRQFMPAQEKKNLGSACAFYGVSQTLAHRAEADAESAHFLYQELARRYASERPELFEPKALIYKAKRDQPATKRQKEYLHDLIKCHRIDVTVQIDAMSRSEASRMVDQILSQYGRVKKKEPGGVY